MGPYWLMFLIPAWAVLQPRRLPDRQSRLVWMVVGVLFATMMGLRHQVGGDWFSYLPQFLRVQDMTFREVVELGDPGYALLNWVVGRLGGGIYAVNLACAVAMIWGTVVFCRRQPNPWLALLVAVPYMLIVVGMGYTRQAVALGFALLGLAALGTGRMRVFVAWVVVGALFHKSAVLLLPIAALAASHHRLVTWLLVGVVTALTYYLLLADSTELLWTNYVVADYQSQGGAVRVAMNVLPALLLVIFHGRLEPDMRERKLWLWMSAFALVCIPLVGLASTAVDRVALYLIPLQLFVFSRLPRLARSVGGKTLVVLAVIAYYAIVQWVWLNYAATAFAWIPYRFMPMGD